MSRRSMTLHFTVLTAREIVGVDGLIVGQCAQDEERGRDVDPQVGVVVAEHACDRAPKLVAHLH
ncbi:MAG: hypothetical protein JWL83_1284, partial [Actinomycetia bacterium]|nr:hypothetical protein [Actinomycetes bacterium]